MADDQIMSQVSIPVTVQVETESIEACVQSAMKDLEVRNLLISKEDIEKLVTSKCESLSAENAKKSEDYQESQLKMRIDGFMYAGNTEQYNANLGFEYQLLRYNNKLLVTGKAGVLNEENEAGAEELHKILSTKVNYDYLIQDDLAVASTILVARDDTKGEKLRTEELLGLEFGISGSLKSKKGVSYKAQVGHKYLDPSTEVDNNTMLVSQTLHATYELDKDVDFDTVINLKNNPLMLRDYEVSNLSTITLKDILSGLMFKNLDLALGYEGYYDNIPVQGKERVDHIVRFAFDFKFSSGD